MQTMAAEARKAAVVQLQHQVEACQVRAVKQCATALEARWTYEMPQDPQQWAADLLQTYEECKAEDSLASYTQDQVRCNHGQHVMYNLGNACQEILRQLILCLLLLVPSSSQQSLIPASNSCTGAACGCD